MKRSVSVQYRTVICTYVVAPAHVLKGDRVDVLVEDEGKRDGKVEDVETLGTQCVGQNFNGVRDDDGCEGNAARRISVKITSRKLRGNAYS